MVLAKKEHFVPFKPIHDSLLSSYWDYLHERLQYSGVTLLVSRDSAWLWCKGIADSSDALSPDMPMQIASISKTFVAVGIMQLVERGKIRLNDPLQKFFPKIPYAKVTIEHLLSHGSGIPEYVYFTDHDWEDKSIPVTNTDVIRYLEEKKPDNYYEAGRRHKYTNTNFVLLASIIEKVSGSSLQDYLQKNVFAPAGMKQTRVLEASESFASIRVKGHFGNGSVLPWDFQDGTYGDKNILSTAWDLYHFYRALMGSKLLNDSARNEMFKTRFVHTRGDADYCLGWRRKVWNGETWMFHTGWWHGFRTIFMFSLESDRCAVNLSNRMSGGFMKGQILANMFSAESFSEMIDKGRKAAIPNAKNEPD